jgi:SAM-dependent methyltransferase
MRQGVLLERGEAVSRLKLLAPLPPFRDADILHVRMGTARGRLLLCGHETRPTLRAAEAPSAAAEEVIGPVVAVERGRAVIGLERGLLPRLPTRHWGVVIDILEALRRVRHPLTPPLFQGSPDAALAGVRDKYDGPVESAEYGALEHRGLEDIERALVNTHVVSGGRLLDIGCGGGREAIGFARMGYRVVAIDVAPRMIAAARANAQRMGVTIDFRVQSVTTLAETPGSYDGAFFAGSLHHIPGRALRIETLGRIAAALAPGAVLLLMVVYRQPRGLISRSRFVDAVRATATRLGWSARLSEPGDGYMREVSEGSDPRCACFFHDYEQPADVRRELEAAGFHAEEAAPCWWVCRPARSPLC